MSYGGHRDREIGGERERDRQPETKTERHIDIEKRKRDRDWWLYKRAIAQLTFVVKKHTKRYNLRKLENPFMVMWYYLLCSQIMIDCD